MDGKILSNKKHQLALRPRFLIESFLACSMGCVVLFLWRKGVVGPFFALSDAFSVSGFFMWVFSWVPVLLQSSLFDASSYMARCALSGLFPFMASGYSQHRTQRHTQRKRHAKNQEGRLVGGIFFVLGLILSFIFL